MSYNIGDKVNIIFNEGQVGTIVDRVSDFIYTVELTDRASSWIREFHEDELSPLDSGSGRLFEKFKKEHPEAYQKIIAEWKKR